MPSDLEQVANQITTAESDIDGASYTVGDSTSWNGPYIDAAVATGATDDDTLTSTGFDAAILNGLHILDKSANEVNSNVATEDFLAIKIRGLNSTEFSRPGNSEGEELIDSGPPPG